MPRLPDPAWQESEAATRSPECYCYKLRERRRSLLDSNQTRMLLLHSGRVTSLEEEGLNARNPVPRMHCHASRVFAQTRLTQHSPDRELKMPSRALRVLSRTRKLSGVHASRTRREKTSSVHDSPTVSAKGSVFAMLCISKSGPNRAKPKTGVGSPGWAGDCRSMENPMHT